MSEEGPKRLSRRRFLTVAGGAGAAALATQLPFARATPGPLRITGYPFSLGVTSGDPTPDGVGAVDAARAVAAEPGNGGMPDVSDPGEVGGLQERGLHAGRRQRRGARRCWATHTRCTPSRTGLQAGCEYFYRFIAAGEISPTGRSKTAPAGRAERPRVRVRVLPAVRARLLHGLQAHGAARTSTSSSTSATTSTSTTRTRTRRPAATSRGELQPRDRQPRRLPRAPRAVQDRPGPAGRARRVRVAGDVRRPRGRQQLGRRDP